MSNSEVLLVTFMLRKSRLQNTLESCSLPSKITLILGLSASSSVMSTSIDSNIKALGLCTAISTLLWLVALMVLLTNSHSIS
jgi:hypothetical protein